MVKETFWSEIREEYDRVMDELDTKFNLMETGIKELGFLKRQDQVVTEEILESTVGLFVHVPVNMHMSTNDLTGEQEEVNAWFAGAVAGYQTTRVWFNHASNSFIKEPIITYTLLLADGTGFSIADRSEIVSMTPAEFKDLVEKQKKKDSILMPGKDF